MSNLQKAGGIASLLLGALFIGYVIVLAVVLPALGLGPGTLNDPATGVSFVATSFVPVVIDYIYIGIAIAFIPLALALRERLHSAGPALMLVSAAAGLIASALFLVYAMINLIGMPAVVNQYHQDITAGATMYLALRATANAMSGGALFAAGWSILLGGWAARAGQALPSLLVWLMIGAGIALIASFALLPLGLLGVLLAPVWSIWLGLTLLRGAGRMPLASSLIRG